MIDYRKIENRREAFINWYGWSIEIEDCDSALYMTKYFFNRFEYNLEQRLWLCWLYGTTYHWPTAYVIWNEFPDMELVGVKRLTDWNSENYKRLRYQTDTKWNKGHLPAQYESYKDWVGKLTQGERFKPFLNGTPEQNFQSLWDEVTNKWFKFGRYSTWFYLQTLKQCCGFDIESPNLVFADYSGSKSHRNGFCYAMGKDDWVNKKLTAKEINFLEVEGKKVLAESKKAFPHVAEKMDFFSMETALCSFKKLFRVRDGRYLGYYLDRQAEEIKRVENDDWEGIEWLPLWQARKETLLEKYNNPSIDKDKMKFFLESGRIKEVKTSVEDTFASLFL